MSDQNLTALTDPENFAVVWDEPEVSDTLADQEPADQDTE